jgi:hypothetical protein
MEKPPLAFIRFGATQLLLHDKQMGWLKTANSIDCKILPWQ